MDDPVVDLTLHITPQHERSAKVLASDIAAVSSRENAKNFATNQGVHGHVKKEISRSELAISQAVAEAMTQVSGELQVLTQKLELLHSAFEEATIMQNKMIITLRERISCLECRWWERLMRDLEWDVYGIVDWQRARFGKPPAEILVEVDGDVVDIAPYLHPVIAGDPAAPKPEGTIDAERTRIFEQVVCACTHAASQHFFSSPSSCMVDGCGCRQYVPIGSTLNQQEEDDGSEESFL